MQSLEEMNVMKRSFGYKQLILGFTLAIALTGCAQAKTGPNAVQGTDGGKQTEAPAANKLTIKSYYADDKLDRLIERESTVTFGSEAEKYKAALNALKTPPESSLSSLSKGITFRSADLKNGNIVVDISISNEGRLGSSGEQLLLESFTKTLFQFAEVKSIELLVDGKKTESLMGHVSLPYPIMRK